MTLRGNPIQAKLADRQNPEDTVVCNLNRIVPVRVFNLLRDFRLNPQDPVPQPAVVGTDVSDRV